MTSKRRIYLTGALAGRDFLRRTQSDLRVHQQYLPESLRWEMVFATASQPPEFLAGFVDAIEAVVLMTLEGCDINPQTWEVLAAVAAIARPGTRRSQRMDASPDGIRGCRPMTTEPRRQSSRVPQHSG